MESSFVRSAKDIACSIALKHSSASSSSLKAGSLEFLNSRIAPFIFSLSEIIVKVRYFLFNFEKISNRKAFSSERFLASKKRTLFPCRFSFFIKRVKEGADFFIVFEYSSGEL